MDVGNQIRERRQRLGLSQEELAQRLYVTRVTISHWETGKTLPDVQSMLLLANLFGTTIDEMVRGDVDEMREIVEKNEQQRKSFAIALGAVEVTVIAVLAFMATAERDHLDSALRLLLAVLVLASAVVVLVARRQELGRDARSAAELLGTASGDPVEAARESASANVMRLVLQVFVGLTVGIGVLVLGGLLLDVRDFTGLAAAVGVVAMLAAAQMLGATRAPRGWRQSRRRSGSRARLPWVPRRAASAPPATASPSRAARSCSSRSGRSGGAAAGRRGPAGTDEAAGRRA